jgi:acyl CoA:acetate/3-ketoacid CoA transferase
MNDELTKKAIAANIAIMRQTFADAVITASETHEAMLAGDRNIANDALSHLGDHIEQTRDLFMVILSLYKRTI